MVIKENWLEKVAGFKRILLNCLSSGDTSTTFPILIPLGYMLSRPEVTNTSPGETSIEAGKKGITKKLVSP